MNSFPGVQQRSSVAEADVPHPERVLIVEDDAGIRSLLSAVARRAGMRVRVCEDGAQALALIENGDDPAVILLDLIMPTIDGFSVLSYLREHEPHLLSRVIVITAAGEKMLRACPELPRVWRVCRKPLDIDDLLLEIESCAEASGTDGGH